MNADEVVARVEGLPSGDDETAHWEEDRLHQDVLAAIAEEAPAPWCDLAAAALLTKEVEFSRWYA